jgi:hypothetical protein
MAKRSPKEQDRRQERPGVYGRVEGEAEALLVHPEEVLAKEQVARAGDGQKLGEALHHA